MTHTYAPAPWEARCKELGLPEWVDLPDARAVTLTHNPCQEYPDCQHWDAHVDCPGSCTFVECWHCARRIDECECHERSEN